MKGREIKERLQGKIDPETLMVLVAIGELASVQQQEIATLAKMLDNVTDILMQLGATIEGTHNAVSELRKMRGN